MFLYAPHLLSSLPHPLGSIPFPMPRAGWWLLGVFQLYQLTQVTQD